MVWSIIIMTDMCGEVFSVPTHVAGRRTEKGLATIRKLTLLMCCKNTVDLENFGVKKTS